VAADARASAPPLVIIQARMGSHRLPGKVLADLEGVPLLQWLVERIRPSMQISGIVVATTTEREDEAIVALSDELGVGSFRGHPTDVLDRFAAAARAFGAEAIARVSADSPLIDHEVIDAVAGAYANARPDLAENHRRRGWPVGTAVEVMDTEALERLHRSAKELRHREHVTLFAYESGEPFSVLHVDPPAGSAAPDLRLCVDTTEDLERVRSICASFAPRRDFSLAEIVAASART
jgi:spore coat polysaccharide biosynthesis protein SpsF